MQQQSDKEYSLLRIAALQKAKDAGLQVVYPENNELQIDADSEEDRHRFYRVFHILQRQHPEATYQEWVSRSGNAWHIRVTLPFEVTALQRIALQAALGSDGVRELLGYIRHTEYGDPQPTLFLEQQ